jgi:hypothetical protein
MSRSIEDIEEVIDLYADGYSLGVDGDLLGREKLFKAAYGKLQSLDPKPPVEGTYRCEFDKSMWTEVNKFSPKNINKILKSTPKCGNLWRIYYVENIDHFTFFIYGEDYKKSSKKYRCLLKLEMSLQPKLFSILSAYHYGKLIKDPNDYYDNDSYFGGYVHDAYGRTVPAHSTTDFSSIFEEDSKDTLDVLTALVKRRNSQYEQRS